MGLAALALLAGCLDIPDSPDPPNTDFHISVYVTQKGQNDSTLLKIHPEKPATLIAQIHPKELEPELKFCWYRDSLLGETSSYRISPDPEDSSIPNKLVVKDREGNSVSVKFKITVNSVPEFYPDFSPAQGDTLYGTRSTPFTFSWNAEDREDVNLSYTLELDTTAYPVGSLKKIQQSGLEPGIHIFRVIAKDSEGDMDSLPFVKFYVVDTLEAIK